MVDVYVIGRGPAELAAALEFAEVGLRVRVGHASVAAADDEAIAGFAPHDVTDADGTLRAFLDHVAAPLSPGGAALSAASPIVEPPEPVLLRGARGGWAMQPEPSVFGIPAVPLSEASLAILGSGAATRAFLDRVWPVLTIGKTRTLGKLVRSRIGAGALDRLVEPFVSEKFGVAAADVYVAIAAPGLNEDVTTAGSLCGAALSYSKRHVARETRVRPAGGWSGLRDALIERLAYFGVEFADGAATGMRRARLSSGPTTPGVSSADGDGDDDGWIVEEAGAEVSARAVIVNVRSRELPGFPRTEAPQREVRWIAELDVTAPDFATTREADRHAQAALEAVVAPSGERWSARWLEERNRPGSTRGEVDGRSEQGAPSNSSWQLRLSGPSVGVSNVADSSDADDAATALGAIGEPSRDARGEIDALISGLLAAARSERAPGAELQLRLVPAPFTSISVRDRALAHITLAREAESSCVEVGPESHSGDLAAAVLDARAVAVQLRRRLTGIAE